MAKINYKWIKNELIASTIVTVVFAIVGIFLAQYFAENSYPVDYEYIDSYDWATIFRNYFLWMSGVCLIYHIGITLIAAKTGWHGQVAWLIYGIIAVIISLIMPIVLSIIYPEESLCTLWMFVIFIAEYVLTYSISTYNCSKDWNFFPTK